MSRCLNERALVALHGGEATAEQQEHVRWCADCAERYEAFASDLDVLTHALHLPVPERARLPAFRRGLIAAAGCAASVVVVVALLWRPHPPEPPPAASGAAAVSVFADDVSEAVFTTLDTPSAAVLGIDLPELADALDAGQPCTRGHVLSGQCSDEISAFASDDEP